MSKQYRLITDDTSIADPQKTLEITEEFTKTIKDRTSAGQKIQEYERLLNVIRSAAIEADEIVAELGTIKDQLGLAFKTPSQMQDESTDMINVPRRTS